MKTYVLGFMFSPDNSKVVLIHKKRPLWQVGLINGVGGHVEENESTVDAMRREFLEETGVLNKDWELRIVLRIPSKVEVFVYRTFSNDINKVKTLTDEEIVVEEVCNLPFNIINNLTWIVPMLLDNTVKGVSRIKIK